MKSPLIYTVWQMGHSLLNDLSLVIVTVVVRRSLLSASLGGLEGFSSMYLLYSLARW